jgi:hypothetical protein
VPSGAVAVGRFEGSLALGSVQLASGGLGDGFALSLAGDGAVAWGAALTGAADQDLTAVAIAGDGSIAVAGGASGPARLGEKSIAPSGQPGAIAARLDARGAPVWLAAIAATDYAVPTSLAWTGEGDLLVAGYFAGTLDPAGAALHAVGGMDVWVARLAGADGRVQWIHRAGGPGTDAVQAIASTSGAAMVVGSFQRWADFSSTTLRGADESADPFVAAVGPDGFVWAHSFPTDGHGAARAVTSVAGARLAVALTFDGAVQLGDARVEAGAASRGAVVLIETSGELVWSRLVESSRSAEAIASAGDQILVAGASDRDGSNGDGSNAGSNAGPSAGPSDRSTGYVAALSAEGAPLWSLASPGLPTALAAVAGGAIAGGSGFLAEIRPAAR